MESVILGFIASILPAGNTLSTKLEENNKTWYFYQQAIKSGHGSFSKLRVYEIQACRNGCSTFIGVNYQTRFCSVCEKPNDNLLNDVIYYFPLADRITKIIRSDLKNLLNYPKIRRPSADNFFEDIYDGENYKWFQNQMDEARYI